MMEVKHHSMTAYSMGSFSRQYANRGPKRTNWRPPATPSQDFDWPAAIERVKTMLSEMYPESESDDSVDQED